MKNTFQHLTRLFLILGFVSMSQGVFADLNHYVPDYRPDQKDPCPPDEGDPCKSAQDGESSQGDQGCASNKAGDPFDLHSGEFEITKTYLRQPNSAVNMRLSLHYSTYMDVHTTVGYSWTHNYNMRLHETSQGRLVMVDHQGNLTFFNKVATDSYLSDDVWESKATFHGGLYTVTRVSGRSYTFDVEGRLTSIIDEDGGKLVLTYAPSGQSVTKHAVSCIPRNSNLTEPTTVIRDYRVHQVKEVLASGQDTGRVLTFNYNPATGLLSTVVDAKGRTVTLGHDSGERGDLVTLTDPENLSSNYSYYTELSDQYYYYGYMKTFSREGCSGCSVRTNEYYAEGPYGGWVSRQYQGENAEGEDIHVQYQTVGNGHRVTLKHYISRLDDSGNRVFLDSDPDPHSTVSYWDETIDYITDANDTRRVKRRVQKRPVRFDDSRPAGEGEGDYYLEFTYYGEDAEDYPDSSTTTPQVESVPFGGRSLFKIIGRSNETIDGVYIGKVKTKRDYDGNVTHFKYYPNGLVKRRTSEVSDTVDHITEYQYDDLSNLTDEKIWQTDRASEVYHREFTYYPDSKLLKTEKQWVNGSDYLLTEYIYYPAADQNEALLKYKKSFANTTLLSTTVYEYTTSSDVDSNGDPQPLGLVKKIYDLDTPARGVTYSYTSEGYLEKTIDAQGIQTVREYDGNGRITVASTLDTNGTLLNKTIRTFTGTNLTEEKIGTDADGYRITKYGYDTLNRRSEIIRVDPDTQEETILEKAVFASDGREIEIENAAGDVSFTNYEDNLFPWVTETRVPWKMNGLEVLYSSNTHWYDSHGRAYMSKDSRGTYTRREFDGLGREVVLREAFGNPEERVTRRTFDANNNVVAMSVYSIDDQQAEVLLGTTNYYYDLLGRPTGVNWNPASGVKSGDFVHPHKIAHNDAQLKTVHTDALGNQSTVTFNRFGNIQKMQFADRASYLTARPTDGNDLKAVYDVADNLIQVTDGRGLHRYYRYDSFGRPTHTSVQTNQDWSATTWWTDPAKVMQEVEEYSAWGEALQVLDADRVRTTSTYDDFGRLYTVSRPESPTLTYSYTDLDQIQKILYPAYGSSGDADYQPATSVDYVYDSGNANLLKSVTDRAGNTTTYNYDIRLMQSSVQTSYNAAQQKYQEYEYDVFNRVRKSRNVAGQLTIYDYDGLGNLVTIYHPDHPFAAEEPNSSSSIGVERMAYTKYNQLEQHTGAGVYPVKYGYDLAGNRTDMWDNKNQGAGALFSGGSRTHWKYDNRNRVQHKFYAFVNDSSHGDQYSYTYNANGAIKTATNGKGVLTNHIYEQARNLLKKLDYPTQTDSEFVYDKALRMTQMIDESGTTDWVYDGYGRLETVKQQNTQHAIHYGFDAWSRVNDRRVRRIGTAEGDASEWRTRFTFDAASRLANIYDHLVSTTTPFAYTRHANADLVTQLSFPSGAKQTKSYDALGRLDLIEAFNQNNSKINSFDYRYNDAGQRDKVTLVTNETIDWKYDQQRQLDTATKKDAGATVLNDFDYDFDAIGNRLQESIDGQVKNYYPNAQNQYAGIGGTQQNPTIEPSYDDNGSLLADGHVENLWSERNRLRRIIDPSKGTRSEYLYDAMERRTQRADFASTAGGTATKTTRYLFEGRNALATLTQDGQGDWQLETTHTWGIDMAGGVGGLLAITNVSDTHYVCYDGNGNVVDLLDSVGSNSAHYEYDAFGNLLAKSGSFADDNVYRFSTRVQNTHAGDMLYYGYRYYDSSHGRWLSRDPLEEAGGMNIYGFVYNDGINFFDVDGRMMGGGMAGAIFAPGVSEAAEGASQIATSLAIGKVNDTREAYMRCIIEAKDPACCDALEEQFYRDLEMANDIHQVGQDAVEMVDIIDAGGGFTPPTRMPFKKPSVKPTGKPNGKPKPSPSPSPQDKPKNNGPNGASGNSTKPSSNGAASGGKKGNGNQAKPSSNGKTQSGGTSMDGPKKPSNQPLGACFVAGTLVAVADGHVEIEQLSVGDRVLTSDEQSSGTHVNQDTWKLVDLSMPNPECPSDILEIKALRSPEWLEAMGADTGALIHFVLDEIGLEGPATVLSISECPEIESGEGRVVLSTITHFNAFVHRLTLESGQHIELTQRHRIFSVDRNAWVQARHLQVGETLRTRSGELKLENNQCIEGVHRVFNLEVETEHCYFVSEDEVLSHNTNPCAQPHAGNGVTKTPQSPNQKMRDNANKLPFVRDPKTNKLEPVKLGDKRLEGDHLFPKKEIMNMPGFDKLTPAQKGWVLNHPINTQGLTRSQNASKGSKLPGDWKKMKGEPLHPDFIKDQKDKGALIEKMLQNQINAFNAANGL